MHKARYLMPGLLFPEETTVTLDAHDPQEALRWAPANAYCFILYDLADDVPDLGPDYSVTPNPLNESEHYYLGGELFTAEDIRALPGDHRILVANMEGNHWPRMIRCRMGNWQPFEDGDVLLDDPVLANEGQCD